MNINEEKHHTHSHSYTALTKTHIHAHTLSNAQKISNSHTHKHTNTYIHTWTADYVASSEPLYTITNRSETDCVEVSIYCSIVCSEPDRENCTEMNERSEKMLFKVVL
jgi:hypothetical protein